MTTVPIMSEPPVAFFAGRMKSGDLYPRELPLRNARFSANTTGDGTFTADLDLREAVGWDGTLMDATRILDMTTPGSSTITPMKEYPDGNREPYGHWWITQRERDPGNPTIRITGAEFPTYTKRIPVRGNVKSDSIDPIATARITIEAAFAHGPVDITIPSAFSSSLRVPAEWKRGQKYAWDAVGELIDPRGVVNPTLWEWGFWYDLVDGGNRIQRRLRMDVDGLNFASDVTFDLSAPGGTEGAATGMGVVDTADEEADEVWAWGVGSGEDQVAVRIERDRREYMPALGYVLSVPDAPNVNVLRAAAWRGLRDASRAPEEPFTVHVPRAHELPFTGPRIGDNIWLVREPSLSMPDDGERSRARVIGWDRTWPEAGEEHAVTYTLERI